jgi:type I restriction enzyme S subunit
MTRDASKLWRFDELIAANLLEIGDGYRARNEELVGNTGPIFLRAGHVTDTEIDFTGVEHFDPRLAAKVEPKMSLVGDTVVTTKGNSTGRVAFVSASMPRFVYSPHLSYWRSLEHGQLVPGFVRYWARGPAFRVQLEALSRSTDMAPYLSLSDQRRLAIELPSPAVQRAIAALLGALDDKIELNRQMNETLEAMARALFKSWFVDFDPVRAKMEGRAPFGMDAATAKLFPSALEASEGSRIPAGWSRVQLGDLLLLKRGYDLPHAERQPGSIPIVSSSGVSGVHSEARAKGPGVVTGRYGTIGRVFLVDDDFWPLNTTLYVVDFKGTNVTYAYHVLCGLDFAKYSDKAAVPGINRNHLHTEFVLKPSPEVQLLFGELVSTWQHRVSVANAESHSLAQLRDLLLPKLLSGELRIRDAERAVEAVL